MQLHFILSNFSSLVKSQAEQSKAEGRDVSSKQGNCYLPILVVGGHVSLEEAFFAAVMNTPPPLSAEPAAVTAAARRWLMLSFKLYTAVV